MKKRIILSAVCHVAVLVCLSACARRETLEPGSAGAAPGRVTMTATVLEADGNTILVEPVPGSDELLSGDRFSVGIGALDIAPSSGDTVAIAYSGEILESYPCQLTEVYGVTVEKEDAADTTTSNAAIPFEARYIRTDGYVDGAHYPQSRVIGSAAELRAYYEEHKDLYDLDYHLPGSDPTLGFLDAMERYDDAYFQESRLIVVFLEEGSGSVRHEVTGVSTVPGKYLVDIRRDEPEVGTCDMAEWHILIEAPAAPDARDPVEVRISTGEDVTVPSGLIGVGHTDATPAWSDHWGIKLTVRDVTPRGLTIVCTQRDGSPTGELMTGSPYTLERLENGAWAEVQPHPLDWTAEAWMIPENETVEWPIDWSRLYGELPAGSYRISKRVSDERTPAGKPYYADFELLSPEADTRISCVHDGFGVSLPYMAGWEYEIEDWSGNAMSWGVNYRPIGEDGWIRFHYCTSFGVCGTGLEEEPYGAGRMGTYDGHEIWDFIAFPAGGSEYDRVVAMTENVDGWWDAHGDEAMKILDAAEGISTIID